jgi:hypothetical protein
MPRLPLMSAEWHRLAMLHFDADPAALRAYVPPGTELDLWHGQAVISVVGLLSRHTRALGLVPAALPPSFAQINVRTYVRRPGRPGDAHLGADGCRHGAVFLCELVPRPLLAACARAYGEPYYTATTCHEFVAGGVYYGWCLDGAWSGMTLEFAGAPAPLRSGSEAEFLAMRHWGYNYRGRECQFEHPRWQHWSAGVGELALAFGPLVSPGLAEALGGVPRSADLLVGSKMTMFHVGSVA